MIEYLQCPISTVQYIKGNEKSVFHCIQQAYYLFDTFCLPKMNKNRNTKVLLLNFTLLSEGYKP